MMRLRTRYVCVLLSAGTIAPPVMAQELPSQFTLGRYIPEDAWFYTSRALNPERAWIDKQWSEVFEALKRSGIDRDIIALVLSLTPEQERVDTQAKIDRATALVRAVHWGDLFCGGELAFAERVLPVSPGYDYFLLTRGRAGNAQANMTGLVAILKELGAMSKDFTVVDSTVRGAQLCSLNLRGKTRKDGGSSPSVFRFSPAVFRKADLIGLATSGPSAQEVINLVTGKGKTRSIAASPRFRRAIAEVKAPEDGVIYADIQLMLKRLSTLLESTASETPCCESAKRKVHAIRKAIGLCDVLDYTITTIETQGNRELTHTVTRLQSAKTKSSLIRACLDRRPFKRFDQFIPAEATGFSLSGTVDLGVLYKLVTDFLEEDLPGGAEHIAAWKGLIATIGFDPHRDLFSWLSGELIRVTLPPVAVTPLHSADSVVMIRVKDSEIAAQKLDAAINFVQGKIREHRGAMKVTTADVETGNFRQLTHPLLAMVVRPVIGVNGDWLVIATSAEAVNKCLAVSAGKAPSIMQNRRFREEGLVPSGPVLAVSFKDTSRVGHELGGFLAGIGLIGGIATAGLHQADPEARRRTEILQNALSAMMKLGPVLQKIDFYSSQASMTVYDGAGTIRTEKLVTYKKPPAGVQTAEAAGLLR